MNSLQLKLTQEQWRIQQFCPELEQFMLLQNVHERQRFKVIICVLEAINNILDHTEAGLEQIVLIMHCNDDRIIVDLLDHSTVLPKIEPHHCPEQMNEHGRGLWIMYNWMDEVRFQPTVLGTHLRLILLRRH
ncbi:ATP-binding protein [Shewanella sp. SP2S2-4]|jgi:serine/threonine-protein kinase RsbW|uniref:ATP-binding protein n=3 Tax=Shewanellaceae TaxID=267890 RepID=A0ABU9UMC8_9GAMM|nr:MULTISPECIES: ATP-binding protein [Shewanella]AEG09448.1 putative anti-sigma regulatory factor, serine/threonine protein kinase [Shewanella baltica BA175]EHQ17034.1 putative anti-sigma regulatory factor, serine/threonine protein kinase [Shewanella baltica OS183]MDT3273508.1 ATP-binding protein [Shewanella sp. SP2S2-4]MDT3281578.1 ATP-binding protein [Shewanella sp. SP2S1-2]MDT3322261.1 ATP-binding protein [Shewanella sp. SP1S2-4]